MLLVSLLVLLPLIMAVLMLICRGNSLQKIMVTIFSLFIVGLTIVISFLPLGTLDSLAREVSFTSLQQHALFYIELAISLLIVIWSVQHKRFLILGIALAQLAIGVYLEMMIKEAVAGGVASNLFAQAPFYVDHFSVLMIFIIGVIGGLITLYANGYMEEFNHHYPALKASTPFFFFIFFLFLAAMFGLVISNNLLWLHLFWEVTTLCSFLLIKYKNDAESINNAFRALAFNLVGGVAFFLGIVFLFKSNGALGLNDLVTQGKAGYMLPILLLAIAGFTKSAQVPCSSWLLGAMVAPTPVSALLHSSTMVKAGVFLLIKLSPALENTTLGIAVATIGGISFLISSFLCISRQNAKALLAYSTIANLGLIVLCAGIGSATAVWAGMAIILFHAISKGLLFLGVGVVEHQIDGREIEMMDGLFDRLPQLSFLLIVGMAGMFLAPFALLISKWVVLKAVLDSFPLLVLAIVFGSSATIFYWSKWMGKILQTSPANPHLKHTKHISVFEWSALYPLGIFTIISIICIPYISDYVLSPYLLSQYNINFPLDAWTLSAMILILIVLFLLPYAAAAFIKVGRGTRMVAPYLSGANVNDGRQYKNPLKTVDIQLRNYYLNNFFAEEAWTKIGLALSLITFVMMCFFVFQTLK
ncbi:MAG: NADH-quinone oxidoreductase subunit L [Oligoflexia bacterium]|nr:NADH-quinone oxidoreductase subunit L [Oligoflexia bacterium]MBF0364360.1 NADH-quinone oxidoreductase subunit L [Oligoflexia bacterium]